MLHNTESKKTITRVQAQKKQVKENSVLNVMSGLSMIIINILILENSIVQTVDLHRQKPMFLWKI